MSFHERPARLAGAHVWTRAAGPPRTAPAHPPLILPDGCMDLVWSAEHGLFVAGPDEHAQQPAAATGNFAGFRFAPGTAPAVLGVPARDLVNRRVALAELWTPRRARAIAARVEAAAARGADPGAALEEAVLGLLGEAAPADPLLRLLAEAAGENRPLTRTARESGTSERLLYRRALTGFGYGPRTLARVLRLQRTLPLLDAGLPLAETAVRAGYADQPHLSRELKALTGLTPRALASFRAGPTEPGDLTDA